MSFAGDSGENGDELVAGGSLSVDLGEGVDFDKIIANRNKSRGVSVEVRRGVGRRRGRRAGHDNDKVSVEDASGGDDSLGLDAEKNEVAKASDGQQRYW